MIARLLRIELMKMRRRLFYVLPPVILAYAGLLYTVEIGLSPNAFSSYQELNILVVSFFQSMTLPTAVFILYHTGGEFENRVVQKGITLGLARRHYFFSKILYCMLVSLVFVFIFLVFAITSRYGMGRFQDYGFAEILLASFGIALTAFSLGILANTAVFLTKEIKKAMLVFAAYIIAEIILVRLAEGIFEFNLKLPFLSAKRILLDSEVYHYVWQNSAVDLLFIVIYPIVLIAVAYYHFKRCDLPPL